MDTAREARKSRWFPRGRGLAWLVWGTSVAAVPVLSFLGGLVPTGYRHEHGASHAMDGFLAGGVLCVLLSMASGAVGIRHARAAGVRSWIATLERTVQFLPGVLMLSGGLPLLSGSPLLLVAGGLVVAGGVAAAVFVARS